MSSTVKHTLLCALLLLVLATAAGQTLRFSVSPSELKPGDKGMLRATVSFPDSMKQSYDPSEGESPYFFLSGDSPALSFGKLSYPKPTKVSSDGFWVYHNSVTLSLPFTVKANAKPGKVAVNATFGYNLCHKTTGFCGMPSEESRQLSLQILPGDAASPAASVDEESLEEQPSGEEPAARTEPAAEAEKPTDGKTSTGSILFYMLMAILGGIVLNFTPCVLPMVPILSGIIVGAGIIRIGLAAAPDFLSNSFEGTPFAAASVVFFNTLTSYLLNGSAIFLILGILLVVGGWAFSDQRWAVQLRDKLAPSQGTPGVPPTA